MSYVKIICFPPGGGRPYEDHIGVQEDTKAHELGLMLRDPVVRGDVVRGGKTLLEFPVDFTGGLVACLVIEVYEVYGGAVAVLVRGIGEYIVVCSDASTGIKRYSMLNKKGELIE